MDLTTLTGEALTAALAIDIATATNEDLAAALADRKAAASALFSLKEGEITIQHSEDTTAIMASIREIKAAQKERDDKAKEAAKEFADAKDEFAALDEDETEETDEDSEDETDEGSDGEDETDEEVETEEGDEAPEAVTASVDPVKATVVTPGFARKAVGKRAVRPTVAATPETVITAAADIPNVPMGSRFNSMADVASAVVGRASGFAPYNESAAQQAYEASGGQPVLNKFAVASFATPFAKEHTGGRNTQDDYDAIGAAVKDHKERIAAKMRHDLSGRGVADEAITAALGWCAPSEIVYNWIADFVVDGLLDVPEIAAPRGGLMLTEGPQLLQTTYAPGEDIGFGGTEAQAIAGYTKTCETIECPEFVDYRLDFDGYCWKIPILTESAFPELVADAMRVSDVAYAHKINARKIADIKALSADGGDATGYGATFLDTVEALVQIAIKERRWWNLGENAVMEVKIPQFVRDVFKFDMARRSGLALSDVATDQRIAAVFANHNLSVSYLSDMQDLAGSATPTATWPANFDAIIYPAGTFVVAAKPVINLSAVYDAASLSQNEYTGVFFEQGLKTIKRGYRSTVVTVPVCTAGVTGANAFLCDTSL